MSVSKWSLECQQAQIEEVSFVKNAPLFNVTEISQTRSARNLCFCGRKNLDRVLHKFGLAGCGFPKT